MMRKGEPYKPEVVGKTGFRLAAIDALPTTAPDNIERPAHLADGAAYPAVRPEVVAATEVEVGSQRVMQAFWQLRAAVLAALEENDQISMALATLRDALPPMLIAGELPMNCQIA